MSRVTQQDIAKRAGVSQATVSLVLNGARGAKVRIPEDTRRKVEEIIRSTGYAADPIAQRMVGARNRILGVFTYEAAFPVEQSDFFTPFLFGIEEAAEELGHDLLLMTGGSRDDDGRKRLFGEGSRLRIADGCILLGRSMDSRDLARLVSEDLPFVAIGRRDDAGGPVPHVGADYVTATRDLVGRALDHGHRAFAYHGPTDDAESQRDRWAGFTVGLAETAECVLQIDAPGRDAANLLVQVRDAGATVVFLTEMADAVRLHEAARAAGLSVPEDLSLVVLGQHVRATRPEVAFTSYAVPREQMARLATRALIARLEGRADPIRQLLPCALIDGDTLAPPAPASRRSNSNTDSRKDEPSWN